MFPTKLITKFGSHGSVILNIFCSRTPRYNFSSTSYPQICWCIITTPFTPYNFDVDLLYAMIKWYGSCNWFIRSFDVTCYCYWRERLRMCKITSPLRQSNPEDSRSIWHAFCSIIKGRPMIIIDTDSSVLPESCQTLKQREPVQSSISIEFRDVSLLWHSNMKSVWLPTDVSE
jgi:hypothetical protein